ncbi:unnamed protein product [Ceutorhynchus assimilis]|uniref:RING-type E3 ubiquitin transferase n=1 Tax=Ceutorhynchus assimilis TaxID=467358 RepID=A0A9P0GSK4_9CUCU|nr:unnamed protein product [Ceutorhynchus assimilis]
MAHVYVPPELREKLVCTICNGYLSVFPIYVNLDGDKSICGRCKIPNDNEYIRDEAYEGLAQFFIFPCLETKNGCTEQLTPLKLKDHEQCCINRKVDCPSKSFTRCNWQGPNKDLKAHFEASHPNLVLKNQKFEIQFLNSIKENMLMQFEEELYIIRKEIDSRQGIFTCSVEHVIQTELPKSFNYYIRFETGDSTHHFNSVQRSTSPDFDEKIKYSASDLREKLNDPAVIVACIEILKTHIDEDDVKIKTAFKNPEVDWNLLAELVCPVCFEYMHPPIFQCIKGHSICSSCKPQVVPCPVCRGEIRSTQNFLLENITGRMIYPCKYHKVGCTLAFKSTEIRAHENCCEFGPYNCPMAEIENCTEKFTKADIIGHIENNHEEYILQNGKVSIPFGAGGDGNFAKYYVIKFSNRIFKVCFKYENRKFYWELQLIGPVEEAKKFMLDIDIIDNSGKNLRQYARSLCGPITTKAQCFTKKGNYIIVLHDQISEFINETLSYTVRVVEQ